MKAALAAFWGDPLAYVFQSFNLIDDLTVEENIELALIYRKIARAERWTRVARAMDRVGIGHRARHYQSQLSGGQQQRAAIAGTLVGVIVADEPTGNLDTENGAQVIDILSPLNAEGATIVMVTHSPSRADLAKRRIDMFNGRVVISVRSAIW